VNVEKNIDTYSINKSGFTVSANDKLGLSELIMSGMNEWAEKNVMTK
jgi:hypothetical protein